MDEGSRPTTSSAGQESIRGALLGHGRASALRAVGTDSASPYLPIVAPRSRQERSTDYGICYARSTLSSETI